tara:strand:+ start:6846 stop:7370 length:525 start_codon:yes stop_codon:yes gene_type:complete
MSSPIDIDELAVEFDSFTQGKDFSTEKKAYGKVPDGNYNVIVDKVYWKEARTGTPFLSWQLRIIDGEFNSRVLFKDSYLKKGNEVGFRILAEELEIILGKHNLKLNDQALLTQLSQKELFIKKQTRTDNEPGKDHYRIYINGCADNLPEPHGEAPASSPLPDAGPTFSDDDIPF